MTEPQPVQETADIRAVDRHAATFQFDAKLVERQFALLRDPSRTNSACAGSLPSRRHDLDAAPQASPSRPSA